MNLQPLATLLSSWSTEAYCTIQEVPIVQYTSTVPVRSKHTLAGYVYFVSAWSPARRKRYKYMKKIMY